MASNPLRVSELIDSSSRLTWQESLALVRGIAAVRGGSPAAVPSGSFEEFALQENGDVTAVGTPPPLSVSELALLLARLLPPSTASSGDGVPEAIRTEKAPAALYFTIARALALVDAPSFASIQDFSSTLARFERARPTALLRQLYKRHTMAAAFVTERAEAAVEGAAAAPSIDVPDRPASSSAGAMVPDRRRQRMPSDVLRRMLREEDRRNFLEMQSRAETARARKTRQTGPDAEMLRRFIREADERTYTLMRASRTELMPAGRRPRRAGYHAAFVLLVLLAAVVGFVAANWQRTSPGREAARADRSTTEVAPSHGVVGDKPAVTTAATTDTLPAPPATAAPTSAKGGSSSAVQPSAPSAARTPASAATRKPAKAKDVVGTSAAVKAPSAKRRGPVPRLFAAIYHRLGSIVRRDANQPQAE